MLDYARELNARAELQAKATLSAGEPVEVTAGHVRAAALAIAAAGPAKTPSHWALAGHVLEYACAIGVGVASSHLDTPTGIIAFAAATGIGLILLTVRLARRGADNA